jgi:hypothetical protein
MLQLLAFVAFSDGKPVSTFPENALGPQFPKDDRSNRRVNASTRRARSAPVREPRLDRSLGCRFQITNISIAFLRSETGGQLKMTFSCNLSSLGYLVDEAKLNVIVRSKGGGALHTWTLGISVKCADKNQSLTPITHDVPNDVAANVFTNVNAVEVAEYTEPNFPSVKVQRCGAQ